MIGFIKRIWRRLRGKPVVSRPKPKERPPSMRLRPQANVSFFAMESINSSRRRLGRPEISRDQAIRALDGAVISGPDFDVTGFLIGYQTGGYVTGSPGAIVGSLLHRNEPARTFEPSQIEPVYSISVRDAEPVSSSSWDNESSSTSPMSSDSLSTYDSSSWSSDSSSSDSSSSSSSD